MAAVTAAEASATNSLAFNVSFTPAEFEYANAGANVDHEERVKVFGVDIVVDDLVLSDRDKFVGGVQPSDAFHSRQ